MDSRFIEKILLQSQFKLVKKIKLKLEKLDIIKETESVGIEITKRKNE